MPPSAPVCFVSPVPLPQLFMCTLPLETHLSALLLASETWEFQVSVRGMGHSQDSRAHSSPTMVLL